MEVDKSDSIKLPGYQRSKPLNTPGMGNPAIPVGKSRGNIGNTGKDFHDQRIGSGDML